MGFGWKSKDNCIGKGSSQQGTFQMTAYNRFVEGTYAVAMERGGELERKRKETSFFTGGHTVGGGLFHFNRREERKKKRQRRSKKKNLSSLSREKKKKKKILMRTNNLMQNKHGAINYKKMNVRGMKNIIEDLYSAVLKKADHAFCKKSTKKIL